MDTTLKKCKICGATFDSIPEIDDCICSECMEGECLSCKAEKEFGGHSNLHTCKNRKERNKKLKNNKLEGG